MNAEPKHWNYFAKDRQWRDGSDGVRYVSYRTDPNDSTRPLSVLADYAPNKRVEPHTHGCDYMEIILEGELAVGKDLFTKGDVRITKAGAGYGPLIAGPAGCLALIVFDRADGAMSRPLGRAAQSSKTAR